MNNAEDYDNFFYENQEIVLETPKKKFKGYITKTDKNLLPPETHRINLR